MHKTLKESAQSIAVKAALDYLEKNPQRNMPRLLDWADRFDFKENGLSQSIVATKLQTMGIKMSRSWLSAIELGKRNIPVRVLVGLKVIFKCHYEDFFAGLEEELLK